MKAILGLFLAAVMMSFGCSTASINATAAGAITEISVQDAWNKIEKAEKGSVQFIDVRTAEEFNEVRAKGVQHFPLDEIEADMAKLDKEKEVYVICRSGSRSRKAAEKMEKAGFKKLYNITGGTNAWTERKLPTE